MRSKAWLAASVSLRLARLPRTATSAQRSRRLHSTLAAGCARPSRAYFVQTSSFKMLTLNSDAMSYSACTRVSYAMCALYADLAEVNHRLC